MRTTRTLQKNSVVVQYAVPRRGVPGARALRAWAGAVSKMGLTLRIVGAQEARALNRRFRRRNYATNVLSFPLSYPEGRVGDIVLCHPVIAREARAQGKTLRAHYAHLVVHGVLHLRGYAHGKRMEHYETHALRRFGFADPYTVK
jgi:probable rRNA maturation factor